ncbi:MULTISPECIES: hypothetical protein [Nocardiopsis]|uniref:Uncharacterized protein n=1 Tax=Nocardiopsis lambiniae TaxID=3075539 RepID=A0ABU2ME70_9ACTN|nr:MULTISPECIES: hypothetical protein [unclassified Nocardiopsis]MDE3724480.1 hypothetical protein [Nocardiopsis sp. N85]MDT0330976.1 hypothetical protein [Nocardiopsis sp. DSM 44743]
MTLERGNAFTPVASATMIWPWTMSVLGGAAGGALFFLTSLSGGILPAVMSGLGAAVIFFSLIGGVGGVLSKKADRRGRRYAAAYPFRYAAVPAIVGGVGYGILTLSPFTAIFVALAIWATVGVIAMVVGDKK